MPTFHATAGAATTSAATCAGASSGIMSTPCIVFLDEPTSGLDSYAALSVMAYLRGMATAGSQTVISSIHQPRAAIWALYDKVCQAVSGWAIGAVRQVCLQGPSCQPRRPSALKMLSSGINNLS